MRIFVINPGATSTKLAVFENEERVWNRTVEHDAAELAPFARVADQLPYRKKLIEAALVEASFPLSGFDAIAARGGLLRHIPSGTYLVSDRMLEDIYNPPYGEHASNLGPLLARELGDAAHIPAYITDPVSTDEMTETARISGLRGMQRESFFHALNHKAMARRAAQQLGKPYEALRLIVVHMGGGVSVAAHEYGRVVDVYNVKDEGSFSMDRGGSLPVNAVVNLCFSGKTKAEIKRLLGAEAGVYSYLGTRDFRQVEERAEHGEPDAMRVYDALVYQHCKDIGAMAAVLRFRVDAVVLTGGMANSKRLCAAITERVGALAPVLVQPGEAEMEALALGALRVLRGGEVSEY